MKMAYYLHNKIEQTTYQMEVHIAIINSNSKTVESLYHHDNQQILVSKKEMHLQLMYVSCEEPAKFETTCINNYNRKKKTKLTLRLNMSAC
jgi:hypothetical protein